MNGSLVKTSFPRLLCELWQGQKSGTLCLQRRLVDKKLYFRKGRISHGESNLLHETMASYLVKEGLITEEQRQAAINLSLEKEIRIGEALIEAGSIDPKGFFDALRKNLVLKVMDCFIWEDGNFLFEEQDTQADNQLALNLDPFKMLVQGIHTMMPFESMRQDISLILNKPTRVKRSKLPKWADGYLNAMSLRLIKAFHEPKKPRFIMQDLKIEEEAMLRIVYLFDVTGLLINTENPLSAEDDANIPEFDQPIVEPEPKPAPDPMITQRPNDSATKKLGALDKEQTEKLRDDVLSLSLKLDHLNHFELLELEEDATVTKVSIGFLKFLERFSLVNFKEGELAEIRDQVENILLAGAKAFADLRDVDCKTRYLDKLKSERQAQQDKPKKKAGAAFAIQTKLLDAGSQFKQGLRHLEQKKYKLAVEFFEYARDIDGHEPLYLAYLAWATYQKDPEGNLLEIDTLFERAMKIGSDNGKVNMLYGNFLVGQGDTKKGLNFLKKAASLCPKDIEVQRAFRNAKATS